MAIFTFDVTAFRAAFPQFASTTTFPTVTLQSYWDVATIYCDNEENPFEALGGPKRLRALNLLTAHTAVGFIQANAGKKTQIIQSASVDKISNSFVNPSDTDAFSYWLNTTPYGMMLLALLAVCTSGGDYIGGAPELSAFRNAGDCW